MNKLAKLVKEMPYEDLLLLKKDLDKGNLDRLLSEQIDAAKANRISLCPVCSSPVKEGEGLHLQFGNPDMRKKATFDGVDCLAYFLNQLKKR